MNNAQSYGQDYGIGANSYQDNNYYNYGGQQDQDYGGGYNQDYNAGGYGDNYSYNYGGGGGQSYDAPVQRQQTGIDSELEAYLKSKKEASSATKPPAYA